MFVGPTPPPRPGAVRMAAVTNCLAPCTAVTSDSPLARRAVALEEALQADEAFYSSTSLCVCPVSRLNGH